MNIRIIARTNLGNEFRIMGGQDGLTSERIKDARGNEVHDEIIRGNRLSFDGSSFTFYEGDDRTGQIFGQPSIQELQIT